MSETESKEHLTSNVALRENAKINEFYGNFIGGEFVPAQSGSSFDNLSPISDRYIDNQFLCKVAASNHDDVNLATDAAWDAFHSFSLLSVEERSRILNKIADTIDHNAEELAVAETLDNGKTITESRIDMGLASQHFRYFAGCALAHEGSFNKLNNNLNSTISYEPYGVVGQIIPWNFPLLMAAWKLGPALAAGNCVVLKPAEQTPISVMKLMEFIEPFLPKGVINIVNGLGESAGSALATSKRIKKLAFTGSSEVGKKISLAAAESQIPCTTELGGKSPAIFADDIINHGDTYYRKCVEGAVMSFFNSGEVCTCASVWLVQERIEEKFIADVTSLIAAVKLGNPLDDSTRMGTQVSKVQKDRVKSYIDLAKSEGCDVICGGSEPDLGNGAALEPTLLKGQNSMRVFQEEVFGPVIAYTTYSTTEEALQIANDRKYGLGANVWSQNQTTLNTLSHGIKAGRVWVNNVHNYPAGAPFGGYGKSGIGRENHKSAITSYMQAKNILTDTSLEPINFYPVSNLNITAK